MLFKTNSLLQSMLNFVSQICKGKVKKDKVVPVCNTMQ